MKKITLLAFVLLATLACNQKNNLEPVVEIPEPAQPQEAPKMGNPDEVKADEGTFQMKRLPYAYNALEPYIDTKTMEIHYSKHHLAYTNKLNKAIVNTPLATKTIEQILQTLDLTNAAVRNNAGGYYNHNLFWEILSADAPKEPKGALAEAIVKEFGSFDALKTQLTDAATNQFGSGWAWLVVDKAGKLVVGSTANQDNPLMPKMSIQGTPILAIDVWEHAYYLNYQNKRPDYLKAIFNVINWDVVAKKYDEIKTTE